MRGERRASETDESSGALHTRSCKLRGGGGRALRGVSNSWATDREMTRSTLGNDGMMKGQLFLMME